MNLLLLKTAELGESIVELHGRRAAHIITVLRAEVGDQIRVGVIGGGKGLARVESIGPRKVALEVRIVEPPESSPRVSLVLAMPRPKVVGRTLQLAASLGVVRIDLVNAWRVHKSYFHSARIALERLREDLLLGCEQGATTWLPDIAVHPMLMPFLDSVAFAAEDSVRLICHPRESENLENRVAPGSNQRVVLAIGPEGGWIQREVESFVQLGFAAANLGPRILRVEAAVVSALSQLELLRRLPG